MSAPEKPRAVRVFTLSEDGSVATPKVQERLVRLLLGHLDPDADLSGVRVEELAPSLRDAMTGTQWKRQRPVPNALLELHREIATRATQDRTFVTVHVDGDRPWSERKSGENERTLRGVFLEHLRRTLEQAFPKDTNTKAEERAERVERSLRRVLPIVPYYSIEAWLFQNTDELRACCREHPAAAASSCLERCDAWSNDRALLDEVRKPKEAVCVGSAANARLAGSLRRDAFNAACAASPSLAATVAEWRARDELTGVLASLR